MTDSNSTVRDGLRVEDLDDREWLEAHPEAVNSAPGWATHMSIYKEIDGEVGLGFDGRFGDVQIGSASMWNDGSVRRMDNGNVYLYFMANETPVTADELRAFAREFAAAADAVSAAGKLAEAEG